jgi:hypothetical protein
MCWQHSLVAFLLRTEVQSCHTSDGNTSCHCIPYDRVRAGHFSKFIWYKHLGGTFCWSLCQFVVERAVWCPLGWIGLVMNRDIVMWSAVSVRWYCDGSCWLNIKGQIFDPEAEGSNSSKLHGLFTRLHSTDAVTLEPSFCPPCDTPKSHKRWLVSPVRINTTCHIYMSEQVPL